MLRQIRRTRIGDALVNAATSAYRKLAGPDAILSDIPLALLRRRYGNELTVKVDGVPLIVNLLDRSTGLQMAMTRRYEPTETAVYRRIVKDGDRVVDVGCNIGYFTCLFGMLVGDAGEVVAIEPDPQNADFCRRNVELNRLSGRVRLAEMAAGADAGTAKLFRSTVNFGDHRLSSAARAAMSQRNATTVSIVRIDDVVGAWPGADFVKIDVQGYEALVYAGMRDLVRRSPALVLAFEYAPWLLRETGSDPVAFISQVEADGFTLFEITDVGDIIPAGSSELDERFRSREDWTNLLAVRPPCPRWRDIGLPRPPGG